MIKNWSQFQHYKDKTPSWIKLYVSLLSDFKYRALSDKSKLLMIHIWLLAAQNSNRIPHNMRLVRRLTGIRVRGGNFTELIENGYLVPYDSRVALDGIYIEKIREEKRRRDFLDKMDKTKVARQSARPLECRVPARAGRIKTTPTPNRMVQETEEFVQAAGLKDLSGSDLIAGIRNYLKKGVKP